MCNLILLVSGNIQIGLHSSELLLNCFCMQHFTYNQQTWLTCGARRCTDTDPLLNLAALALLPSRASTVKFFPCDATGLYHCFYHKPFFLLRANEIISQILCGRSLWTKIGSDGIDRLKLHPVYHGDFNED